MQKPLNDFGEELIIPLYVEIIEEANISEFLEEEMGERTRSWAFIPKRLIANVNITTVQTENGNQLKIAAIGERYLLIYEHNLYDILLFGNIVSCDL